MSPTAHRNLKVIAFLLLFAAGALQRMPRSFWLDETMTAWVIASNFFDLLSRVRDFQGPGPLHFIVCWLWSKLFGAGEIALRMVSVLSILFTAGIIRSVFSRRPDQTAGLFAASLVLFFPEMFEAAFNARCYALAICLFSGAIYLLCFSERTKIRLLLSAVFAAGVNYCQPAFLLMLPLYPCLSLLSRRGPRDIKSWTVWLAAVALLSSGLIPQIRQIASKQESMGFTALPGFPELIEALIPPPIAIAVVLSTVLPILVVGLRRTSTSSIDAELLKIGVSLWLYPTLALFIFSRLSGLHVFHERYLIFSELGIILILAALLSSLAYRHAQVSAVMLALLLCIFDLTRQRADEDWRMAIGTLGRESAEGDCVLAFTGHAESSSLRLVTSPEYGDYLRSPFEVYRLANRPLILPLLLELSGAPEYLASALANCRATNRPVWLIARRVNLNIPSQGRFRESDEYWIDALSGYGLGSPSRQLFSAISVTQLNFESAGPEQLTSHD